MPWRVRGRDGGADLVGLAEERARPGHLGGRGGRAPARRERLVVDAGQVDPAHRQVLPHVAQEVRQLERHPEARHGLAAALGHAEQRRHEPADGRGAALHVVVELGARAQPDGRVAVHAHGVQVGRQQLQRQPVARAGVHERREDRVVGAARGYSALELRLPGVELGALLGGAAAGVRGAVDDLVSGPQEAVERMDRGPHGRCQQARREGEHRVVARLHPRAMRVGPRDAVRRGLHARAPPYAVIDDPE